MTAKDLEEVANLGQVIWDQKIAVEDAVEDAKRADAEHITGEAKNPENVKEDQVSEGAKTKRQTKAQIKDAERLDWEALHPKEAKVKFLKQAAIAEMSEHDLKELKAQAKDDGMRWSDVKDEKIDEWIANNWGDFASEIRRYKVKQFEQSFYGRWAQEHGTLHPDDAEGEDLLNRIRNADELYEVPDSFQEVTRRLKQAGCIKLVYSTSKTYANVIDKPVLH